VKPGQRGRAGRRCPGANTAADPLVTGPF